jgi:subtilase family serine protease
MQNATYVGAVSEDGGMGMQVLVAQRDPRGLVAYAQSVSDPSSGNYRNFLTPTQIADRFGASQADYSKAADYFKSFGIHVSGWPQRQMLAVTGKISALESAFGTKFAVYKAGSDTFIGPMTAPHFTTAQPVSAVVGLVHAQLAHSMLMRPSDGQTRGYSPQQMQRAFDYSGAIHNGIDGTGINVAIVGTGPISPADTVALSGLTGARMGVVQQVNVTDTGVAAGLAAGSPSPNPNPSTAYPYSSGFQSPPPVTAPCGGSLPTCNPEDVEAQLDDETVAGLAPGATTLHYLAYNPNDCWQTSPNPQNNTVCAPGQGFPAIGIAESDPEIQQIIADNTADAVNMSFGLGEPLGIAGDIFSTGYYDQNGAGYGPIEMASMVAEGMAVFASSGDTGAFECRSLSDPNPYGIPPQGKCVSYPAGDPNVTSVGGVTGPLNDDGTLRTLFTAWGDQTSGGGDGSYQNNIGTGGGISTVFPISKWQNTAGVGTLTSGMRGQPDISLMADPNTGPTIAWNAAFPGLLRAGASGGTSLSSPMMAAMWALVLQACKADAICNKGGATGYRLGNPAPLLYAIYGSKTQYPSTMFDVTYGDISAIPGPTPGPSTTPAPGYMAGVGYDLTTGIGVPFAGHLINAVITNQGGTNPNLP